jgi:transketolase
MTTMRERFASVATELVDQDPRVAVVLADISVDRFARAMRKHPDRVINVGIREQLLVSVAGGLAMAGLRPIAHTYAPFLVQRPFEQLKLDLGHQGLSAVVVSIGASYDASDSGRTHHAPEDVALIDTLPDWTIHVPGHPDEVDRILRGAVTARSGSVYVRLSGESNASAHADGKTMVVVRRGTAAAPTIVAVGPMLAPVLRAVEDLDVSVLYAATIRPFDGPTLRAIAATPDVILVEPYLAGTSAAAVNEALRDRAHRLLTLGVGKVELRRYGEPWQHAHAHGLDPAGLRTSIDGFLAG